STRNPVEPSTYSYHPSGNWVFAKRNGATSSPMDFTIDPTIFKGSPTTTGGDRLSRNGCSIAYRSYRGSNTLFAMEKTDYWCQSLHWT
ncbi:hypothetical protein HMI56_006105, partial [Coelomomyces lativittatus]